MVNLYIIGGATGLDILSGIFCAFIAGNLDSSKLRKGLLGKLVNLIAWATCVAIDYAMGYFLTVNLNLAFSGSLLIATMEFISVIENICEVNPSMRRVFYPFLNKLKEDIYYDTDDDTETENSDKN